MGKKIFKKLAFMCLAVCMGVLTLFGTACTPTQANQTANVSPPTQMTTESAGLIYPKAEDPTLYTTESGLEIKYGLSTPTISESLSSGNLAGFPYFTTTKSSTTYTWVIIGIAPDLEGNGKFESLLFSNWKEKTKHVYAQYFKNNIYDITTPAGSAINSSSTNSYVMDYTPEKFPGAGKLVSNDEIPSGCVLALSNSVVGSVQWYDGSGTLASANIWDTFTSTGRNGTNGDTYKDGKIFCIPVNTLADYDTNDTFGFGTYLSSIKKPTLIQRSYYTQNGTGGVQSTATHLKFFPLGGSNYSSENFKWETYLTASQYKTTQSIWGRSMYNNYSPYYTNTSGTVSYFSTVTASAYLRPACVISLN